MVTMNQSLGAPPPPPPEVLPVEPPPPDGAVEIERPASALVIEPTVFETTT